MLQCFIFAEAITHGLFIVQQFKLFQIFFPEFLFIFFIIFVSCSKTDILNSQSAKFTFMFTLKRVFVFLAEYINQTHELEISCTIVHMN